MHSREGICVSCVCVTQGINARGVIISNEQRYKQVLAIEKSFFGDNLTSSTALFVSIFIYLAAQVKNQAAHQIRIIYSTA